MSARRSATDRQALKLAALLATSGVGHFVAPRPFDAIVPSSLPGSARTWTYLSGAAELGTAVALVLPRTRRLGGLAAAPLFIGAFPADVKMARDWRDRPRPYRLAAYARLPVQVPLVYWGVGVARAAVRQPVELGVRRGRASAAPAQARSPGAG